MATAPQVTSEFSHEIGPARERASSLRYESWVAAAGGRVRGVELAKQTAAAAAAVGAAGTSAAGSSPTFAVAASPASLVAPAPTTAATAAAKGAAGAGPRRGSSVGGGGGGGGSGSDADSEPEAEDLEVVQLKFLQKSNQEQMLKLRRLWNLEPQVIHYYLNKFIFPEHMRTQRSKLSASGQSVGGDMLVGRRVGFSGTPSDLLPREMGRCEYETGDDGKMLTTVRPFPHRARPHARVLARAFPLVLPGGLRVPPRL